MESSAFAEYIRMMLNALRRGQQPEAFPMLLHAGEWEIPRIPLQYQRAVFAVVVVPEELRTTHRHRCAGPGVRRRLVSAGGVARASACVRAGTNGSCKQPSTTTAAPSRAAGG